MDDRTTAAVERVANPLDGVEQRWSKLGAREIETDEGGVAVLERNHAQSMLHGDVRLVEAAASPMTGLLDELSVSGDGARLPEDAYFVDLETTGLSKADIPFCIGVGTWEGRRFVVRHFVMRREEEERAALQAFLDVLSASPMLVSYNGRSFDVPMLVRRLDHYGVDHALGELPHLDLLDGSRRAWPKRDTHKLSAVERDICGLRRHDDVAGARIPQLWRDYLEDGQPGRLMGIFEHNRLDILSLLALLPALAGEFGAGVSRERSFNAREDTAVERESSHQPERIPKNSERNARGDSPLKQSLSRNYQLRGRRRADDEQRESRDEARSSGTMREGQGGSAESDESRDRVRLGGSFSRSDLRKKMPVGQHLRELRSLAETESKDADRLPILLELVAIEPRHPFALRELASLYRSMGKGELAEVFERRLEDTSPY